MDTHVMADRDLVMARRIPAPPAEVFAAWTQPERIKQWFGPYCMTCPEAEVDLRPGGFHRALMRDAAGKEYPAHGAIDAVEAPHRLVMRVVDESCGPLIGAVGTLTFEADGEGTLLTVRYSHPTEEMRATHEAMGFVTGWGETIDKLAAHCMRPAANCPAMGAPPSKEHGWLTRLIGEWSYENECANPETGETMKGAGRETVRALGGFWVVGEMQGTMPGGMPMRGLMTVGFDQARQRFVGSWTGSMMGHMFVYDGWLAEDGRTLTLENEGPSFTGEGTAKYRDIVEMVSDDHRIVSSRMLAPDGSWTQFMSGQFRRVR